MAYSTQADVTTAANGAAHLIELTDLDGTGVLDVNRLNAAIAEADSWIDSHVAKQYATPLNPVPAKIKGLSADEATYILTRRRKAVTAEQEKEHVERQKFLEQVRDGVNTLGVDPGPPASTQVASRYMDRSPDEDISIDSLKGFW
jgi:phage gp36-like protein